MKYCKSSVFKFVKKDTNFTVLFLKLFRIDSEVIEPSQFGKKRCNLLKRLHLFWLFFNDKYNTKRLLFILFHYIPFVVPFAQQPLKSVCQ
jgi:hypothetical protein